MICAFCVRSIIAWVAQLIIIARFVMEIIILRKVLASLAVTLAHLAILMAHVRLVSNLTVKLLLVRGRTASSVMTLTVWHAQIQMQVHAQSAKLATNLLTISLAAWSALKIALSALHQHPVQNVPTVITLLGHQLVSYAINLLVWTALPPILASATSVTQVSTMIMVTVNPVKASARNVLP